MWLSDPPDSSEALRQGDLLQDLLLPTLRLPITFGHPAGRAPQDGDTALLPSKERNFLIVSQCCTIENHHVAALAPIRSTPPMSPEERAIYSEADFSLIGADDKFVFNVHTLDPIEKALEEVGGRAKVADLTQIVTCTGDDSILRAKRVARMSPAGRRLLRMRLSVFWGRVEAEDLAWFKQEGLPPGPAQ
jgi:hypothetical protein